MVYLEATTMEILRLGNIVPFSVQHGATHDVTFRGYVIPADAVIIPNVDSVLFDEDVWGDPHAFRPERFIDDQGKLIKREELIPFSTGE